MKASELRIGNYYNHNGDYRKVNVNVIEELEISDRVWIKPIELTEEILLKCGFFYDSDADTFKISNCTIQLDSYGFDGYMVIIFGEDLRLIKNLHQLQNIYWCLCEKELEIQL